MHYFGLFNLSSWLTQAGSFRFGSKEPYILQPFRSNGLFPALEVSWFFFSCVSSSQSPFSFLLELDIISSLNSDPVSDPELDSLSDSFFGNWDRLTFGLVLKRKARLFPGMIDPCDGLVSNIDGSGSLVAEPVSVSELLFEALLGPSLSVAILGELFGVLGLVGELVGVRIINLEKIIEHILLVVRYVHVPRQVC